MTRIAKNITRTLSTKLSLMVVCATTLLLMASLGVMLYFSRSALKEEAINKADQTLEATIQHIDNILLSVEQAVGNIYFTILPHLDQPQMMFDFCEELLKSNSSITGCAVAFEPYFYEGREHLMAYVYRTHNDNLESTDSPIIQAETFGNCPYTEQVWYTEPIRSGNALWLNPLKGMDIDIEPFITFTLPIPGPDGTPVGVLAADVSLNLLSHIILAAKPSPNSYSVLLDGDGSYILHPDSTLLTGRHTVFTQTSHEAGPTVRAAAEAMMSGQTGYSPFTMDGTDYYVFYKPFIRSAMPGRTLDRLQWSTGIVYPEDDIFGDYHHLLLAILAIAAAGLLLLYVLCRIFVHKELQPLGMLTTSARRIAEGHYDEPIPDSHHHDEIGTLQNNFQAMQQSLSNHVSELQQLNVTLQERGEVLHAAYERAQMADRMKTAVLHNMTNQMMEPTSTIDECVGALCDRYEYMSQEEAEQIVSDIQKQGKTITDLLNHLLAVSDDCNRIDNNDRKEETHA